MWLREDGGHEDGRNSKWHPSSSAPKACACRNAVKQLKIGEGSSLPAKERVLIDQERRVRLHALSSSQAMME